MSKGIKDEKEFRQNRVLDKSGKWKEKMQRHITAKHSALKTWDTNKTMG